METDGGGWTVCTKIHFMYRVTFLLDEFKLNLIYFIFIADGEIT